ncbi:hypothetical protein ACOCJ4_13815 [Knoellia sp. CPCC 206435]|uniref:hypothetical protein n=1 Tax=Knoellia terrae TaxID=3404797 RepID=UPI003B4330A0
MFVRTPLRALAATALAAGAVIAATPAHAAGPTHTVESVEFTLPVHGGMTEACGFPVSLHVHGTFTVVMWTDEEGNPTREIRNYRFRSDITANGVTIQGTSRGPELITYTDEDTFTVAVHGVVNRRVPGAGTVTLASGRSVLVVDGESETVTFRSGPDDETFADLCDAFTA